MAAVEAKSVFAEERKHGKTQENTCQCPATCPSLHPILFLTHRMKTKLSIKTVWFLHSVLEKIDGRERGWIMFG